MKPFLPALAAIPVAMFLVPASAAAGSGLIIVGADTGGSSVVRVFDSSDGTLLKDFTAFSPLFSGGVTVAGGDVNGDGVADYIVGMGSAGGTVNVFDGVTGASLHSFSPFGPGYTAGVTVASSDVNHDGIADIVVGSGSGSSPMVGIYDGLTLASLNSFSPLSPSFIGGITVAASDLNHDGFAEILVGTGPGPSPVVEVYSGQTSALLSSFSAFNPTFTGGVSVAAAAGEIVAGTASGDSTISRFAAGTSEALDTFPAYPGFFGGVSVGAADLDGDGTPEIVTGPQAGMEPTIKLFDGATGDLKFSFSAFDPAFTGGVNVALVSIPEPSTAALLFGTGTSALAFLRRRRR